MSTVLGIDFETRSAADIRAGSTAYAEHPSTRVLCASMILANKDRLIERCRWFPGDDVPEWTRHHIRDGGIVIAHNMGFERAVLEYVLTDWPRIDIGQWADTMTRAAALALPESLEGIGAVLGAKVQKDAEGHELMLRLCKDANPEPTPEELQRLMDYCERDVESMLAVWWKLPPLPLIESLIENLDRKINARGVYVNRDLVAAMVRMANERKRELAAEVWEETEDLVAVTAPQPLIRWLTDQGIDLPLVARKRKDGTIVKTVSLARDVVTKMLTDPTIDPTVTAVLEARTESSRATSLKKLDRVLGMLNADGRLRNALHYHGAHTGRWSSRGLQVHNLPRPSKAIKAHYAELLDAVLAGDLERLKALSPDVLLALSHLLRAVLAASPGHDLIGGDFAAIEARVLAWLAGQFDVLDIFASGHDIYVEDAAKIGSDNRDLGKVARLGLGYGMGDVKFAETANKAGVFLSYKEARFVRLGWRENNPMIVQFWADLEEACHRAALRPGVYRVGDHITVVGDSQRIRIVLPSGRSLNYWRPHLRTTVRRVDVVNDEGERAVKEVEMLELRFYTADRSTMVVDSTYGGKLVENVTQAVSRDLLGLAQLRVEAAGYPVVGHVHDSVFAEVVTGTGSTEVFAALAAKAPTWGLDLPLVVEPYRSPYFKG